MKRAISLIELILAIVIVGIGVTALPTIAFVSSKGNTQTVLSEVVTSTRIFMDDILLEPYNSALAEGFTGENGATLYTGIVKTSDDDRRFKEDAIQYFSRSIAKKKNGEVLEANLGSESNMGLDGKFSTSTRKIEVSDGNSKNILSFQAGSKVSFLELSYPAVVDGNITEVFDVSNTKLSTETSRNAMLIEVKSTGIPAGGGTGAMTATTGGSNSPIIDDIDNITLRGFAFNISTEPR